MRRRLRVKSTRILVDFIVIVAGVLVALALDSWAESRRNNRLEISYLARLVGDIRDNNDELRKLIDLWSLYATSVRTAIDCLPEKADCEPHEFLVAAVLGSLITMPTIQNPTFDEIIAASRLELLRDAQVRAALLTYNRRLGFGDPFLSRLDRQYEAVVNEMVPAQLVRSIARECRPAPFGIGGRCVIQLDDFDLERYRKNMRAVPNIDGKLNWRLADAIRVHEIFEIRLTEAEQTLAVLESALAGARGPR
jgi:hypothetical protein